MARTGAVKSAGTAGAVGATAVIALPEDVGEMEEVDAEDTLRERGAWCSEAASSETGCAGASGVGERSSEELGEGDAGHVEKDALAALGALDTGLPTRASLTALLLSLMASRALLPEFFVGGAFLAMMGAVDRVAECLLGNEHQAVGPGIQLN